MQLENYENERLPGTLRKEVLLMVTDYMDRVIKTHLDMIPKIVSHFMVKFTVKNNKIYDKT